METALCACGCGEEFIPFDNRGRPRKFIYGHQGRNQRDLKTAVICEQCGKEFKRPQWHMKRVKHHFCSQACEGLRARATGKRRGENNGHFNSITVPCSGCAAPITKAVSLIERRNGRVYCTNCVGLVRRGRKGFYVGYPKEFSASLRTQIRKRDSFTCQECGKHQAEVGTLHVHHIDYNKHNNAPHNLIALCRICHGATNFATEQWQAKYEAKMAAPPQGPG